MQLLYCIKHEETVFPFKSPYAELSHSFWVNTGDPEFEDFIVCDFDGGWATCPPPEFDLDEYIDRMGNPPAVIESDFATYGYDIERDEIILEELP